MSIDNWHTPLPEMGILAISGKDAAKLLQGQTTCDILGLPPGQTTLGALCTPKGRAIAVFRVLRAEDKIYLLLPTELLETVQQRLRRYVLRDDVKIDDETWNWTLFGLLGEKSTQALQILGLPLLTLENEAEGQGSFYTRFYAIRIPDASTARFLVLVDAAKSAGMCRFLEGHGLVRQASSRWVLEDIRAGLPSVTKATVEEFVPQMLNLDLVGGISFNKGCYTGQEIIARAHFLGSLKRRMVRLAGAGGAVPQAGESLQTEGRDGPSTGRVVSSASDEEGGFEVLAVVNVGLAEDAQAAFKTAGGVGLALAKLPYPLPSAVAE
jgi:folate-binding protein YgfZ